MAHSDTSPCSTVIDSCGFRCPVPTLRLQRAVRLANPGSLVRLIADDPMVRIDVPHFATEAGLEIVEMASVETVTTFVIRVPEKTRRAAGGKQRVAQDDCSSS